MKHKLTWIIGLLLFFLWGISAAQLTPEQEQLKEEFLKQNGGGNVQAAPNSQFIEQYKSPNDFSSQDSSFYTPPEGGRPDSNIVNTQGSTQSTLPDSLKIFGYNMFDGSPESFSPVLESTPPPDYKLGPGDNILINIWGRVDMQLDLTVDREGTIFIPKAGQIVAWGMTLDEFSKRLESKLSAIYSDFKYSVTLGKIRRIKVFVYGEVKRPGAYTTSSLATLFNALYLAGGPTQTGSLRLVKHIRNNQVLGQIDLYHFLIDGDNSQDSKLESGDVIFVPVVGPLVRISGQVKRPAIYEITGGEKISDLIKLAGGSTAESFMEMVSVERISKDDSRIIKDVNLSDTLKASNQKAYQEADLTLKDGDRLWVPSVFDMKKNTVKLGGNVKHPGTFGLADSMRVLDLIDKGGQLKVDTYLKRANLFRTLPDQTRKVYPVDIEEILSGIDSSDYKLMDKDSLVVYSQQEMKRQMNVIIYGAIKHPGTYEYFDNMKLSDLIFLGGNPLKQSYMLQAEIARVNPGKPANVLYADLEKVLNDKDSTQDILLSEDDKVFIRTIPRWRLENNVTIDGEVMFPGTYAITKEDEKLLDLINRCGGLTPDAFMDGIVYMRSSISQDIEKRQVRAILASTEMTILDSLNRPLPKLSTSLDLTAANRIIIDTKELLKNPQCPSNITLVSGDYIFIPHRQSGVQVLGAVASTGTIAFRGGKTAGYFIKSAGGFCRNAEKGQTRLAKSNGKVFAGHQAFSSKVDPGDMIIVPQKIKRERGSWFGSATSIAAIVTSVATVILLTNKLK